MAYPNFLATSDQIVEESNTISPISEDLKNEVNVKDNHVDISHLPLDMQRLIYEKYQEILIEEGREVWKAKMKMVNDKYHECFEDWFIDLSFFIGYRTGFPITMRFVCSHMNLKGRFKASQANREDKIYELLNKNDGSDLSVSTKEYYGLERFPDYIPSWCFGANALHEYIDHEYVNHQ